MTGPTGTVCLIVLAFSNFHGGQGQDFQLFFGTQPIPVSTMAAGRVDPNCTDKINNCAQFGQSACHGQYENWARDNCALTCHFCVGPTTQPPPCMDMLDNCASFQSDSCTNPDYRNWAESNCRRTCRLCPASVLAQLDALSTTMSPSQCVDKVDCRLYGKASCTGDYAPWARRNCLRYCGFCQGEPTTSKPCLDTRPNCNQYDKDMCTNPSYTIWVEDNCPQYCGRCPGGSGPQTQSPILTPPPLHSGKRSV